MPEQQQPLKLDWADYLSDIYKLVTLVEPLIAGGTAVVGRAPDGLIPAVILAEQLGLTILDGAQATFHRMNKGSLLYVVGVTATCRDVLDYKRDCKTAAVYLKPSAGVTIVRPDVYVKELSQWVVFPYGLRK